MKTPTEIAVAQFSQGFNCAQSVLAAFSGQFGLDEAAALKLTSPFGGGVARRGHICGAVTGALLVLGLARGAFTPEEKEQAYSLAEEFLLRFEARHQTVQCRDLIGYDLSQPGERQQARQAGVFQAKCPLFVRAAAEMVQQMLERTS